MLTALPGHTNVRPHPPIKRSLEWVVKTLAKAGGFELVPFRAYEAKRGAELAVSLCSGSGDLVN